MSDELVIWLRAQIDEDERVAQEAPTGLDWREWPFWIDVDDQHEYEATNQYRDQFPPARMLREVEAKRLRLDEWIRELGDDETNETAGWLLRVEALPYADRPGYRDEWRPA